MNKYVKYLSIFLFAFVIIFINVGGVKALCSATNSWQCEDGVYNGPSTGSGSASNDGGSSCIDNCNKSAACTTGDRQKCSACTRQCQEEANEEKEKYEDPTESFDSDATSNAIDATTATSEEMKEIVEQAKQKLENDKNNNENKYKGIIGAILKWGESGDSTVYDGISGNPCALINGEVRDLLHQVFLGISIGGIIILIVMTAISLIKVITASEDNALSNFIKGLWKRIICLIILLLLPTIITFLIQVVNGVGVAWNINSGNPLCDITE